MKTFSIEDRIVEEYYQYGLKKNIKAFHLSIKLFSKKARDFKKIITACDVSLTPVVSGYLVTSKAGPKLMYFLAKNEKWLKEICEMNPKEAEEDLIFFEENLNFF